MADWPGWGPWDAVGAIAWLEEEYDGAYYATENPNGRFMIVHGITFTAWALNRTKTPRLIQQRLHMFNHRPMFEVLEFSETAFVDDSAWDCGPDIAVSEFAWGKEANEVPVIGPEGVR